MNLHWSTKVDIILIYYLSREVPRDIVAGIIDVKVGRLITLQDMRARTTSITARELQTYGVEMCGNSWWDLEIVDRWITRQDSCGSFVSLIRYDQAAKNAVLRVSRLLFFYELGNVDCLVERTLFAWPGHVDLASI